MLKWPGGDVRPGGLQSPSLRARPQLGGAAEPEPAGSSLPPTLRAQPQGPRRAGQRASGLACKQVALV